MFFSNFLKQQSTTAIPAPPTPSPFPPPAVAILDIVIGVNCTSVILFWHLTRIIVTTWCWGADCVGVIRSTLDMTRCIQWIISTPARQSPRRAWRTRLIWLLIVFLIHLYSCDYWGVMLTAFSLYAWIFTAGVHSWEHAKYYKRGCPTFEAFHSPSFSGMRSFKDLQMS